MTFTMQVESYGATYDEELKPGGAEIYVSEQNREEYVSLFVNYTFIKKCENKLKAFRRGFYRVCEEGIMT